MAIAVEPRRLGAVRVVGWTIVWLAVLAVSAEFLLAVYGKYHSLDGPAYGRFMDRHGWLWLHLGGGLVTLLLGPVQFLGRLRRARPRLHRQLGRVYLYGLLVASAAAAALILTTPAPFSIRAGFAATALAWLSTALAGMVAIRHRRIEVHQQWMVRNYVVSLAPVMFRLMLPAAIALGQAPSSALVAMLLWASWLLPLAIVEVFRRLLRHARGDAQLTGRATIA